MKRMIKASSSYTDYFTHECGYNRYSVHIMNGDKPDFSAQVSLIAPYDDADYCWAMILDDKSVLILQDGEVVHQTVLPKYDDFDYAGIDNYINSCLDYVSLMLERYNKQIESRICRD